jgi:outer membrane protein OmpA-like peptidoglycan-associated protein
LLIHTRRAFFSLQLLVRGTQVKWIVALAGFIALGLVGITFGGLDRFSGASGVRAIETTLQANARQALQSAGLKWARVQVDGQKAILSGVSPSDEERLKAQVIVRASTGKGGWLLGGITTVKVAEVERSVPEKPYFWQLQKRPGHQWRLSGSMARQSRHQAMLEAIHALPGSKDANIADTLEIRGEPWAPFIQNLFDALTRLETGTARIEGKRVSLKGTAASQTVKTDIEAALAKIPAPFQIVTTIVVQASDSTEVQVADHVETTPTPDDAAQCQRLFSEALGSNNIHFASSKAEIQPDSFALLDELALLAERCKAFKLQISGHTDRLGDPQFNRWLSKKRAEAVKKYLSGKGVVEAQLSVLGAGSSKPLCKENTRACRQRNRRIEITVE